MCSGSSLLTRVRSANTCAEVESLVGDSQRARSVSDGAAALHRVRQIARG